MQSKPLAAIALGFVITAIINGLQTANLRRHEKALQAICATLPRQVMMDCETLERPARP